MTTNLSTLLTGASFLLASYFPISAAAQAPTKQWDITVGGNLNESAKALQQTSDGGYILGGWSESGITGDKTQVGQGSADYWMVKVNAAGVKLWDHSFGGSYTDVLSTVQQTSDGGYILGGYSDSFLGGDKSQTTQGSYDYWLVKTDANGNKLWDRTFGGSGADQLKALQQTSDGGYILGGWSESGASGDKSQANRGMRDYWVIKIAADGTKQWDRSFGGALRDEFTSLQQTSDGGYILGGYSISLAGGDKTEPPKRLGFYDYWVVKLNATGNKQWDRTLGGTDYDILTALQQTPDGGFMAAGYSGSGISGDKTEPNQGLPVSGNATDDFWLVKLDATGTKQWDRTFGGTGFEELTALQQLPTGGYLMCGTTDSALNGLCCTNFWLLQVDASGNKQWDKTLGGPGADRPYAIQLTQDGGILVGGESSSGLGGDKTQASQGRFDYWFVKLSSGTTTSIALPTTAHSLHVYPNPAKRTLMLQFDAEVPRIGLCVSLLDATGRTVYTKPLTATNGETAVTIGQHPAGLYLLRLEGPNGYLATQRLILE